MPALSQKARKNGARRGSCLWWPDESWATRPFGTIGGMVDPLTSLAFSIRVGKGIYALLLGSGLSSAAGIPTGWDVTLDLIRKAAAASGEDCGGDPSAWYRTKYGQDADYSELLDNLARTPADRSNLLSSYFEPTAADLEKGLKAPTLAHKSIAQLVARGYVRVIVTTNFDRLLGRAIENEGVSPTVISTADAAKGALPLAHARCTLIKLHGDYRDTRIKNTAAELDSYEPEMDLLLDRVLDEYGLIVCGWSAVWDKALCRAILRSPNRRFTTFWTRRGHLSDEGRTLVSHRQATELEIESADIFFSGLEEKLDAIERYSQPHPVSSQLAVVSLKKFIAENRYRIELRDLVTSETERAFGGLSPLSVSDPSLTLEKISDRMKLYEGTSQVLIHLLAHGAFWGGPSHQKLWCETITRIAGLNKASSGQIHLISLQKYPACLLLYSAGLGAIAGNHYDTLKSLCRDISVVDNGREESLVRAVLPWSVLNAETAMQSLRCGNRFTAMNDRIFNILREPMREYLPADSAYACTFDRFEYLCALVHLDVRLAGFDARAPLGRFVFGHPFHNKSVVELVSEEAKKHGEDWAIIVSGLFPSMARFREVETTYGEKFLSQPWF